MTIKEALQGSGLPSADAEVLLSRILNEDRAWLLGHDDDELTAESWSAFMQWIERRRKHEPVAYIIGEQEFYGRAFTVDRRVLIPRPSTEGVVRRALQFLKDGQDAHDEVDEGIIVTAKKLTHLRQGFGGQEAESGKWKVSTIVDVGTGSGCIAVTLAVERPDLKIIATDISPDALSVARMNAERHHVSDRIEFRQGNGLEPVMDLNEPFLLVSNPPYIPSGNDLMADVKDFEPHVALFGGTEGNDIVKNLMDMMERHPFCRGYVMEMAKVIGD